MRAGVNSQQVMDWDRGTKDDVCGTVLMSMDEIPVMGPDLLDEAAAATWVGEHATKVACTSLVLKLNPFERTG